MKKLLFTLCAVLAGFAANANTLDVKYVYDDGTPVENNEVVVKPGETLTLHINVTNLDGIAEGAQFQWFMRDQAGAAMLPNGNVALQNNAGSRFTAEGMTTIIGNTPAQTMANVDGERAYRIIDTNTAYGTMWTTSKQHIADILSLKEGYEISVEEISGWNFTDEMFVEGNVFMFTITTKAEWADEYATFEFDSDYDKLSWRNEAAGKLGLPDLKILNEDKIPETPKDLTGTIVIGDPDENGYVTVAYNGDETGVTVTVEGYEVVDGKIQLPTYGTYTLNVTASAEGYNPKTASKEVTWTAPAVAPEKPVIEITGQETAQMTITVTNVTEGATLYVNGQAVEGNSYTYTVDRTDIYTEAPDVTVTAKAVKDGLESETATATGVWVVATQPTADEPVIEFVETKNDKNEVTKVEVVVTKATSYKVFVDGEELRGEVINANYTAAQEIHVEAVNDPGYPTVKAENEADYTLNKLTKNTVAAPEITTSMDDNNVYVTITWPESDGEHMYNGEYTYPRTDQDQSFNVEAYVAEGATCAESTHATATIAVPKKVVTPVDTTGQPAFQGPAIKPNHNAYFYTITNAETEPNATIYYRVLLDGVPQGATDENPEGWQVYTGEFGIYGAHDENHDGQDGHYRIEAYAVAPGKAPSKVIATEVNIDDTTGIDELIDGKAIANVRYFNMAGQEMQEANGMTIVVTTYTDGTTSAVKVMK